MPKFLNVAIIQTEILWQQVEKNLETLSKKLQLLPEDTHLVVLPEVFSTGFSIELLSKNTDITTPVLNWIKEESAKHDITIAGSCFIQQNQFYSNTFLWQKANEKIETYAKRHLFQIEKDCTNLTAGYSIEEFQLDCWNVRPSVCYDLRFPVWLRNTNNYDLLINVANWPAVRKDVWLSLLKARALENQCYVIGCNCVGKDGMNIAYSGDSVIYGPKGEVLWLSENNDETVGLCTLDFDKLHDFRKKFPVLDDLDNFSLYVK